MARPREHNNKPGRLCARQRPRALPAATTILLTLVYLALPAQAQQPTGTPGSRSSTTTPNTSTTRTATNQHSTAPTPSRSRTTHTGTTTVRPSSTTRPDPGSTNDFPHETEGFYYIFAALFLLFLGLCLWLVHARRRKRRLMQVRAAQQDALALDIDGLPYPNNRGWAGRVGMFATTRTDEGLNEQGEAPPPYKPAGRGAHAAGQGAGVAIPLQTFVPSQMPPAKPPDYQEQSDSTQSGEQQSSSGPVPSERMG